MLYGMMRISINYIITWSSQTFRISRVYLVAYYLKSIKDSWSKQIIKKQLFSKWRLSDMREVLGSNPLAGYILCSPVPSEETINRRPNTSILKTHALICEELKDLCIPPKVVL